MVAGRSVHGEVSRTKKAFPPGGVSALMDHLRQALGKPHVDQVTDLLA